MQLDLGRMRYVATLESVSCLHSGEVLRNPHRASNSGIRHPERRAFANLALTVILVKVFITDAARILVRGYSRRRHKVPLLRAERSFSLTKRHLKLNMNVLDSGNVPKTVRIALIDDDSSTRKALSRLLCTHGFVCTTYESGEAALADPDLLRMDCLVVDIQLGGINGIELCERVQELGLSIPHVFITACVDRNLPEYPSFMRDSILLVKPIEQNDLVESIQRSLASRL